MICEYNGFQSGGNLIGQFSGNYNELRDKLVLLQGEQGSKGDRGDVGPAGADSSWSTIDRPD